MEKYYDPDVDWETLDSLKTGLTVNAARFDAKRTRQRIVTSEKFDPNRILKCMMRPFDIRWCYYSNFRPLWNEPRPDLWEQHNAGSPFFGLYSTIVGNIRLR